ncbi:hypothetical protein C2S52_014702 [Perilla frutescens var. hirtella]|nr:hypothetical protein C2S52_014702 [Perilla frutescens var. hirtella]
MKQMHDFKVKVSSFDYNSNLGDGDLAAAGFSWPPRSYICSFCRREFRSAQALGGHMNVHRRDRARLRQSPARDGGNNNGGQFNSLLDLNLEPSPSIFPSTHLPVSSSLLTKYPPFTSEISLLTAMKRCGGDAVLVQNCGSVTTDLMKLKASKGVRGIERFKSSVCKKGCEGVVSLELGMGMGFIRPSKEELDLELRLGYN